MRRAAIAIAATALATGCASSPPPDDGGETAITIDFAGAPMASVPTGSFPPLDDDLDRASIRAAIEGSLGWLREKDPAEEVVFGDERRPRARVVEAAETLLALLDEHEDDADLDAALRERFVAWQTAGTDGGGEILMTGYFEPELAGSRERTDRFRYPLYRPPEDDGLRGQTRDAIDEEAALADHGLEIVWLDDPVERFFLHVQGSGRVKLAEGGILRVGFVAKNGHPYRSIGKMLIAEGSIPADEMSLQAIRAWLAERPDEIRRVLSHNPSYVYFEARELADEQGPLGNIGVPLTTGRSIATDTALFPKGAVAILSGRRPVTDETGAVTGWETFTRLVVNQDTGGAIKGPGRADLYCGSGETAERIAGYLRHPGRLYFLMPR